MKVFLSARYSRREELKTIREVLKSYDIEVCSRWLDTEWTETERESNVYSSAAPPEYREQYAQWDKEDVLACDVFIAFTEQPRSNGRGGRHVEFGIAVASGKKLLVVGPRENIFYYLPSIRQIVSEPNWNTVQFAPEIANMVLWWDRTEEMMKNGEV